MKDIFTAEVANKVIERILAMAPESKALWGKMTAAQMFAHCCVTYEMVYDNIHPKPGAIKRFILKLLIKPIVVGEKPYKRNSQTAPEFIQKGNKNFEIEKDRLIQYIIKTQQLGRENFEGRESLSFGILTTDEWNNMFYKHIDHHLCQFGV